MRNLCLSVLFLFFALLLASCQSDPLVEPNPNLTVSEFASPGIDPELAAFEIMKAGNFPFDPEVELPDRLANTPDKSFMNICGFEREDLGDDIAHYSITLRVGWGEYDKIVLHRVVKERRPYRPVRTTKNIFLQHGDAVGFVKFLYGPAAPSVPDDHAAAIYLAQGGVDVWGIDQNWVRVPAETADLSFMSDWGMDNQIQNLRTGLAVARFVRLFSGGGFRTMNLLGYSSGCATGYAYLNDEAVRPVWQRHVGGFVCADMVYKFAPEDDIFRENICTDVAFQAERLASGEFGEPIPFVPIGELAVFDPDGDSPFIPGLNNLQTALYFGAATFDVWPWNATWHYFGGSFDPDTGLPVDLNFTSIDGMTDFMRTGCSWEALRFLYEYEQVLCDEEDVPWDDNLAAVEVPILYLEPVGGIGATGRHTLGLFGSADIQISTSSLLPPDQIVEDFGHIDIWTAPQAAEIVWQPLLQWIEDHTDGHCVAVTPFQATGN